MVNIAWLAGFYDGEGFVSIIKSKRNGYINPRYYLQAGVSNTNLEILKEIQEEFGGYITSCKFTGFTKKGVYSWRVQNNKALPFLESIQPYTKVKDVQVCLALRFLRTKNDRRHDKSLENLEHIECMRNEMRLLNNKGGIFS